MGAGIGTACWAEGAVPVTVSGGIGGAAESWEGGAVAAPPLDPAFTAELPAWAMASDGAAARPSDNRMAGSASESFMAVVSTSNNWDHSTPGLVSRRLAP